MEGGMRRAKEVGLWAAIFALQARRGKIFFRVRAMADGGRKACPTRRERAEAGFDAEFGGDVFDVFFRGGGALPTMTALRTAEGRFGAAKTEGASPAA